MKGFLIFILVILASIAQGATYYLSTLSGDDNRTPIDAQNLSTPWKTIEKLNAFAGLLPGDSVLFKRGETFYGSMIISKSGNSSNPLTYGAYGIGAKPIITGFRKIVNWTNLGGGLYETVLNAPSTSSLNMVLLNGALQPIGRYPKAGLGNSSYFYISSFSTSSPVWTNSSGVLNSNGISSIKNFVGGEIVHRPYQWTLDRAKVTGQTSSSISYNSLVSPSHPNLSYPPITGHGFFFQNHVNCLTNLGDWAYDASSKKLTMFFGNTDPYVQSVEAATQDVLCTLTNKSNISIVDISFTGANENAINLNIVAGLSLKRVDINFIGINGIHVSPGTQLNTSYNTIDSCSFNWINNNSINAFESTHWLIADNHIDNTGTIQGMGISGDDQYIGICAVGSNSVVEYNHVENIGYSGIRFLGNNTIIRNNHIHHFCLVKSDGGGIYTYEATGANRLVHKNIVHDGIGDRYGLGETENLLTGQVHGIYLDGNTTNVTVTDNTSFNNSHSGLWFGSNGEIIATGNTLYDNTVAQLKGIDNERTYSNIVAQKNILFAKKSSSLAMSFNISDVSLNALTSDSNFICRPVFEPTGINSTGYTTAPSTWNNYHDGGTIEANGRFYSVDKWVTWSHHDNNSRKTSRITTSPSDILFEYNASKLNKTIILDGLYTDLQGNYFTSFTLAPYSSIILLKTYIILPTRFNSFTAKRNGSDVYLDWAINNEINSGSFEIERSSDGINFYRIVVIQAKNLTTKRNEYRYQDMEPLKGKNFYRVKYSAADGKSLYSQTLLIQFESEGSFTFYPNPVRKELSITIAKDLVTQNGYITLKSFSGETMKVIPLTSSTQSVVLNMSKFPNAMYIISYVHKDLVISRQIIKSEE